MTAKTLMILGSMSSAGKSTLVTGLCRLYARRGFRVAPFKAQNMSNNAAVCAGGEIGRAQASQAYAAGLEPTVAMNPILLKPEADFRSQVVVEGQVWGALTGQEYYPRRDELWPIVTRNLDSLRAEYDLVIMEGAGSPAEMNLFKSDIVNLAVARYADSPCLLAGDIDRGGVFAQLLGTWWLLPPADQELLRGFIVNKFRGEIELFTDGVKIIEERSGRPVVGVVPYMHQANLPDEDAADIQPGQTIGSGRVRLAVIALPLISNFDDFDPLFMEPDVSMTFVREPSQLGRPDAILIPGTKSTLSDLEWLRRTGLADAILSLHARGCPVIGLCGGYQMLGQMVSDPDRVETGLGTLPGLGLLPARTVFCDRKTITQTRAVVRLDLPGWWVGLAGQELLGYEIHMGQTECELPLMNVVSRQGREVSAVDGCCTMDGRTFGSYLHGIFCNDAFRQAWITSLGGKPGDFEFAAKRMQAYDRLADTLESSLRMDLLDRIIGIAN